MTQIVFSLAVALLAFWMALSWVAPLVFDGTADRVSGLSLDETIQDIKLEIAEIGQTPGDTAGLVLSEVKIELTAQKDASETGGSGLAVPVFKESALSSEDSLKITHGSKIEVVFGAPSGDALLSDEQAGRLDLSELVLSARDALLSTKEEGSKLEPKSVSIEVNFVFVKSDKISAGVKAHVVNLGAASEEIETGGNKVVLTYKNPALVTGNGEEKHEPPR